MRYAAIAAKLLSPLAAALLLCAFATQVAAEPASSPPTEAGNAYPPAGYPYPDFYPSLAPSPAAAERGHDDDGNDPGLPPIVVYIGGSVARRKDESCDDSQGTQ